MYKWILNKNGLMFLDCKVHNCELCGAGGHDCPDEWKVLSTSVLTIERKYPGFTLIPDEMASNCPAWLLEFSVCWLVANFMRLCVFWKSKINSISHDIFINIQHAL